MLQSIVGQEEYAKQQSNPGIPSPDKFVKAALPTLGFSDNTCGYWAHPLMLKLICMTKIMTSINRKHVEKMQNAEKKTE